MELGVHISLANFTHQKSYFLKIWHWNRKLTVEKLMEVIRLQTDYWNLIFEVTYLKSIVHFLNK